MFSAIPEWVTRDVTGHADKKTAHHTKPLICITYMHETIKANSSLLSLG